MAHRMRHSRATYRRRRIGVALLVVGAIAVGLLVIRLLRSDDDVSTVGAGAAASESAAPSSVTSGDASATAPSLPTTSAPPADATVTITAVGDTMLGKFPSVVPNASTYFDSVHDDLTKDSNIVFGNLEGTLTNQAASGKCAGSSSGS